SLYEWVETFWSREVHDSGMARIRPSDLSETQRKILTFLCAGRSNPQIAAELGIARETVKWNVSQLLSLLGVDNRQEAAQWYRGEHLQDRNSTGRSGAAVLPANSTSTMRKTSPGM